MAALATRSDPLSKQYNSLFSLQDDAPFLDDLINEGKEIIDNSVFNKPGRLMVTDGSRRTKLSKFYQSDYSGKLGEALEKMKLIR